MGKEKTDGFSSANDGLLKIWRRSRERRMQPGPHKVGMTGAALLGDPESAYNRQRWQNIPAFHPDEPWLHFRKTWEIEQAEAEICAVALMDAVANSCRGVLKSE